MVSRALRTDMCTQVAAHWIVIFLNDTDVYLLPLRSHGVLHDAVKHLAPWLLWFTPHLYLLKEKLRELIISIIVCLAFQFLIGLIRFNMDHLWLSLATVFRFFFRQIVFLLDDHLLVYREKRHFFFTVAVQLLPTIISIGQEGWQLVLLALAGRKRRHETAIGR